MGSQGMLERIASPHQDLADGTIALRGILTVPLSFAPGTASKTIIQACANEMGVPVGVW